MFCTKCGNKIKDDAKFCSKCGNLVKIKEEKKEVKKEIIYQEEKKIDSICSNKIIIALALFFLVFSISLIGIISYFTNSLNAI